MKTFTGPCPVTARVLLRWEITILALMYWPGDEVQNAVDVCWLESGFQTAAHNSNGEDSRGLWQINVVSAAHPSLAGLNLFDPQVNAYYAYRIWQSSGWGAWFNSAGALGLLPA